jgi:phosphoribosylaminoimidazolecarboxamide formyltransferase/IMP cyclohydrolase
MLRPIRRALLSVSDKSGLVEFARELATRYGVELVATGGTKALLLEAKIPVRDVADLTNFPEILDGRVKTLHPAIYAGLLAKRTDPKHMQALSVQQLREIDLVVCNLYPFEQVSQQVGVAESEVIENIDIGGPCMIRAAAKNYESVTVIVNPTDYPLLLAELKASKGQTQLAFRRRCASTAFIRVAEYDNAIKDYFDDSAMFEEQDSGGTLSAIFMPMFELAQRLRHGENQHQQAMFYRESPRPTHACVATAQQLHGKELSYNNIFDLDSALNIVREFTEPAVTVVKHGNPCGAATAPTLLQAFTLAWNGDPLSAFGGILAFNKPVDLATAQAMTDGDRFVECIIAPDYEPDALELLQGWKKNVRLLSTGTLSGPPRGRDYRRVDGGLLVQNRDIGADDQAKWQKATKLDPSTQQKRWLWFAWLICKHVKSNAIVLASGSMTGTECFLVGVGAGQMSRVDATNIAIAKAGSRAKGSVLASDAFFPFKDNVESAARAGIVAIVQPGGSQRDQESVDAANAAAIPMMFTGVRHFRH